MTIQLMNDILISQIPKKYQQFGRFLIAGGFVFALNLGLLYAFTDILHIHYLISTVLAFVITFMASFLLQKIWTFEDRTHDRLHFQIPVFLGMQLANIILNTSLMYVFVEYLHLWYLLSQAIISFAIAVGIFFINKFYIFKAREISQ